MGRNRLGGETSPYLLQHRDNPVHWWPWGTKALETARRTGKPILLSVGYAACHWCHVMAHESFEDPATAEVMNDLYVNIKVDREERPDIDAIYMSALHSLGEHGGWPLTMFLDSEGRPFWGGTYFPDKPRFGKPSFAQVLKEVARIHREDPARVRHNAEAILEILRPGRIANDGPEIGEPALASLVPKLVGLFDPVHGGIRGAPKFPQFSFLNLVWRLGIRLGDKSACEAVTHTLDNICQGGIYDHLAGGFARYCVDERWLVPHFEKMLYDNALLVELMTEVWRETGSHLLKARVAETIEWILRDMTTAGGAFSSSYDADSEGEEGKFYVWSLAEVTEVLGEEAGRRFAAVYDVTSGGNFEGHNILNRLGSSLPLTEPEGLQLAEARAKLLARRTKRVPPGFDDKVLADWNGLTIAALAKAGNVFGRPEWIEMAEKAFDVVCAKLGKGDRLSHSYRAGKAQTPGVASDYANMIRAALRLYAASGQGDRLEQARRWTATLDAHHWMDHAGYSTSADDTHDVIVRLRSASDDATPNANAVMGCNLVALYLLTSEVRYLARAEALAAVFSNDVGQAALGHTGMLAARMDLLSPLQVVVIDGPGGEAMRRAANGVSLDGAVELHASASPSFPDGSPLHGKTAIEGKATAYVCAGTTCSLPITQPDKLRETLLASRAMPRAN